MIKSSIRRIFAKAPGFAVVRDRNRGRDAVTVERKTDDQLRLGRKNLEIISSQREDYRNTTFSPATALQLQINVVGTCGGRVTVLDGNGGIDKDATRIFRKWAKHAEFTRGTALNDLLRLLLTNLTHVGGDFIAVFDDGILTSADDATFRVRIFEPDQIKNIPDGEFAALFPEKAADGKPKYVQINGFVKDYLGRIVSAFVGNPIDKDTFASGEYISLPRLSDPGIFTDSNWIHVGNFDRVNQTRGLSPLHHVQNQLTDLAAIQSSEVAAAKLNAGLGIVLTEGETETDEPQRSLEEALDEATGTAVDDPEELARITAAENAALKTASQRMREGDSAVVRLNGNKKLEAFNNLRPNLNVVEFYDRMLDISGTVIGLTQMYTRLKPQGSYSAARAEMVMVSPVFEMWQKVLERGFLDWLAVRVLSAFGFGADDIEDRLLWEWPKMQPVDEGAAVNAMQKRLQIGDIDFVDMHGVDSDERIDRMAEIVRKFHDRGLVYPGEITTAGAQVAPPAENEPQQEA